MPIYVLHVQTGREFYICRELNLKDITAYAPQEISLLRNGGKWHEVMRTLMPGYIFIKAKFDTAVYYTVKGVAGVIRFLGSPPTPLSDKETEYVSWIFNNGELITQSEAIVENGKLTVISGILKGLENKVISFDRRQKRASVAFTICGEKKEVTLSVEFK